MPVSVVVYFPVVFPCRPGERLSSAVTGPVVTPLTSPAVRCSGHALMGSLKQHSLTTSTWPPLLFLKGFAKSCPVGAAMEKDVVLTKNHQAHDLAHLEGFAKFRTEAI